MDNLNQYKELEKLLRMESRYCTEDGVLLKNAIVEAALEMRPDLIKRLLTHGALKRNFFTEIEGVLVFDKVKFQKFVMNKQFLPDSYTSFKNKIGLTDDNENFVSESREIVLSWPYKDCMLEGGQTKEDAKRNEVFWNEILAPDEINRLTEPKVLTNFVRYDKKGTSTPSKVSINDNYIIKGNNLFALYSLKKKYAKKIKLIYIDPPYNTGNDSFGYNDCFNHSTWATFMRNRLEIAKDLLSEDGSIFVHLDWNEVHYCKVIMDEIFGRECFRNEIIWCYNGPGSPKMRQLNRKHDNILWYSKSPDGWVFNGDDVRLESFMRNRLEIAKDLLSEDGSIFVHLDWNEVHYCKVIMDEIFGRECFRNEIIWCYNGPGSPKMRQLNRKHDNILWYSKSPDGWVFNGDDVRLESEVHAGGFNGEMTSNVSGEYTEKGKIPEDWWTIYHTAEDLKEDLEILTQEEIKNADWFKAAVAARIRNDGEKRTGYLTEKPYKLMERLIKMASNEGDIVLDFFCGSGTTGFSAHRLNRKFILVEQLSETINILNSRFLKIPHIYCELTTANQHFIDEIAVTKSNAELSTIWENMQQTGFLSWKINPKQIEEHASDFADLSLDDKKRFLIECLDKNLLYVPLSEKDNSEFNISNKDKHLNTLFYEY